MEYPHNPVLKKEVLDAFKDKHLVRFIDATLGAGGHAEALLLSHPEIVEFIGIDQDLSALRIAEKRLKPFKHKLQLIHSNFKEAFDNMQERQNSFDGILLDLGVSSMQLDEEERGFSFREEGILDMRMDKRSPVTAEEIINTYPEEKLGRIFKEFGEEKQWKKAASLIVKARHLSPIRTTRDLALLLEKNLKSRKHSIHPATLIFQALRIAVNGELEVLMKSLPKACTLLSSGGRIAIISFHSLEDRIVKQFFQKESLDKESTSSLGGLFIDRKPTLLIRTKKPLVAGVEEVKENLRSRSAKLRVAEKP